MINIDVIQWINDNGRCFVLKLNDVYMIFIDENEKIYYEPNCHIHDC